MTSTTDEDGVDGPFEAAMDAAMDEDAGKQPITRRVLRLIREAEHHMAKACRDIEALGQRHARVLAEVRAEQAAILKRHHEWSCKYDTAMDELAEVVQKAPRGAHHRHDIRAAMREHSGMFYGPVPK